MGIIFPRVKLDKRVLYQQIAINLGGFKWKLVQIAHKQLIQETKAKRGKEGKEEERKKGERKRESLGA